MSIVMSISPQRRPGLFQNVENVGRSLRKLDGCMKYAQCPKLGQRVACNSVR
jgi:hypothetical protein